VSWRWWWRPSGGASGLGLATVGVLGGNIRALARLTKDEVCEDVEGVGVPDGPGEGGVLP